VNRSIYNNINTAAGTPIESTKKDDERRRIEGEKKKLLNLLFSFFI
jgi:hypothetical protein